MLACFCECSHTLCKSDVTSSVLVHADEVAILLECELNPWPTTRNTSASSEVPRATLLFTGAVFIEFRCATASSEMPRATCLTIQRCCQHNLLAWREGGDRQRATAASNVPRATLPFTDNVLSTTLHVRSVGVFLHLQVEQNHCGILSMSYLPPWGRALPHPPAHGGYLQFWHTWLLGSICRYKGLASLTWQILHTGSLQLLHFQRLKSFHFCTLSAKHANGKSSLQLQH